MNIELTAKEQESLSDLAKLLDINEEKVMVQALRHYQAYIYGEWERRDSEAPVGCPPCE